MQHTRRSHYESPVIDTLETPAQKLVPDPHGNAAAQERLRAAPPATAFRAATDGPARPLPWRAQLEGEFGQDLSSVRLHPGQGVPLTAIGAQAATVGEHVATAAASPDLETLRHELTHVLEDRRAGVSQVSSGSALSRRGSPSELSAERAAHGASLGSSIASGGPVIHRRELKPGQKVENQQDWMPEDRKLTDPWSDVPGGDGFAQALQYNTMQGNAADYDSIAKRYRAYRTYDAWFNPGQGTSPGGVVAPEAVQGIKFFHATADTTDQRGVGAVEDPDGSTKFGKFLGIDEASMSEDSRKALLGINEALFGSNMDVVKRLMQTGQLFDPTATDPKALAPTDAFEFDLKMVEYEQAQVEKYIKEHPDQFTDGVKKDINETLNPRSLVKGSYPDETTQAFDLAKKSLGLKADEKLDFMNPAHRIAIGKAKVYALHGKQGQFLEQMKAPQTAPPQSPVAPQTPSVAQAPQLVS